MVEYWHEEEYGCYYCFCEDCIKEDPDCGKSYIDGDGGRQVSSEEYHLQYLKNEIIPSFENVDPEELKRVFSKAVDEFMVEKVMAE